MFSKLSVFIHSKNRNNVSHRGTKYRFKLRDNAPTFPSPRPLATKSFNRPVCSIWKCTMFIQTQMNGELTLQVESLNYKSEMVANCVWLVVTCNYRVILTTHTYRWKGVGN